PAASLRARVLCLRLAATLSPSRHPPHQPLPPSPTRRSSDLTGHLHADDQSTRPYRLPNRGRAWSAGDYLLQNRSGNAPGQREVRSEEHTSELQSRFDLVCRLLLEQKREGGTEGRTDELLGGG